MYLISSVGEQVPALHRIKRLRERKREVVVVVSADGRGGRTREGPKVHKTTANGNWISNRGAREVRVWYYGLYMTFQSDMKL